MACTFASITNPDVESQLYQDLSNAFATQEEADYYFAYTQTQEFKDKFGDWVKDYGVDNKTNWNIYELTGEPKLYKDTLGQYHFKASDGSKIRLDRQVLDFDHIVRKSLIDRTMFQLFGDNITSDVDILEDINIDSIFTDRSPGSIYNMVNGNMVDLQDIKYLVKQRLNMMGIKTVNDKEEAYDPEDDVELETIENTKDIDLRASFEKNSKDNASANIKFMFNFVPEMEIVDGKYKQKQHKVKLADGQEFVYNAYYPFDKLWNMFEETLAGMTDLYNNGTVIPMFDRMVERMYDEFFDNPSITYLLSDIEALPEYKKTEFVQAFLKDKMSYVTSTITNVGNGIEFRSFDSASVTDPSKRLIRSWSANFAKTKLIKSVGDGKFAYDVSRAKAIEERYKNLVLPDIENGTKTYSENVERIINYLSSVGINVDFEIMDSYIQSYSKEGSDQDSNLLTAARNLRYIFENLAKLNTADVLNFNNTSVKNVFSNRKISGQLKRLATQAIKLRRDLSENTVMGAEGKKNWIYSAPSYIKNKIVRLKEDTASELPNNSGYYKNSRILNRFKERLNNPELNAEFVKNFDLVTFLNFKEENVSDEGTDNQDIEQADQITDMMNKVLLGVLPEENSLYYTLTPADKGRMHHLKGLGMIQNVLNENGQLNEEVLDTFTGYIIDELNRIQEEFKKISNSELIKSNPELFVKDYHYKLVDGKPVFFDKNNKPVGNAFKVILFPELSPFADRSNMDADLKAFLELIFDNKNGIITKSDNFIRSHAEMIKFLNNELALQLAIEKQNLKNIKVIREQKGVQTFPALDKRVLNTYKQVTNGDTNAAIDRAVADFTINQMIANVEYTKVFTGDPAYFKDISDFSKRIPGTYTDGTQLVLRAGDNPNFNLAVLPNIEISSKTLEEIKTFSPKLAKAYSKVNATDAQGWITLDRWKFVMERSNHWNPKFEQAYQNMLSGTPTTEDYKYAAQPVKGVHYEVVNGVPRYIKYSAAVLIPHVIKGTQLQQLNDAMVAQGVDEAVVIDGVKVGSVIPSDVVDVNGNFKKVSTNKKETLNIYAGSNENTDLSNFAIRPFITNVETPNGEKQYTFQSVEQGFHFYKSIVADNPQIGQQILKTTNGGQLRRLTNRSNLKMSPEQVKEWDSIAKSIMLNLMYDSYIQNPKAAKKLLDTGNSIITHTQDNTRWKTDFPEVVMTVREMLSEEMDVPLESQQNLKLNSISLRNNNYKIQQDLRPKGVKKTLLGSQIKKTILTNIKLDQMYGDMTGQELVNEFNEVLSAKSDKGLQKLANTIGIDADGNIKNKEALYSELIKSLSERGANENLITALSKEYDLDVVANYRQKTQNTIQSIINNATIKVKTNGASFIQMSSQWFDSIEDAKEAGVKLLVDDFTGLKAPHVYTEEGFNSQNKTQQNNIIIKSVYQQAGIDYAKSVGGVFSLRVDSKPNQHFGNPFTGSGKTGKGVVKAFNTISEAVQAYKDWLTSDKYDKQFPELIKRKEWILNQIQSGDLKGKPIVYYKELNELSHANILDELINGKKKVRPGQVFVTSNYISKFIPNWKELSPTELKKLIDPKLLKMIGYRIPNQGMSSNDSLEIIGILPEDMGDTIVPYVDITKKTGSDFDIDKMYVMIPAARPIYDTKTINDYVSDIMQMETQDIIDILKENGWTDRAIIEQTSREKTPDNKKKRIAKLLIEEGLHSGVIKPERLSEDIKKLRYVEFNKNIPAIENSEEAIDNRIIELMQIILEDEKTYEQLMSPLDSEYLKNEIELLHGSEDNKNVGARFFTPTYQLQKKFDNSGGKSGVGLTANQLVDHMWTQTIGLSMLGNIGFGYTNKSKNHTLFNKEFDILGEHKISDVLSWFLTAYVDIAKDPYITNGNHNQYTSNTVFMLIRAGAPISFVNRLVGQSIIKELANISSLRKSRVKQPDYRKLIDAAKEDLMVASGLTKDDIAGLQWPTAENYIDKFSNSKDKKEDIRKINNALEKDIKADVLDMSLEEKQKWYGRQMSYLELWEKFHTHGEAFAQTVLASKQDVNGGGKDFVSTFINMNRVKSAEKGFLGFSSRFNNTFLGKAYENSTELSIKIMSQLFVTANESAQELYNAVNRLMNPKHEVITNEKLAFELEKSYFSNILGQTGFNLPSDTIKGLFMGNSTVYDRVIAARNTPALRDNYFLSLLDVTMEDGIKFVKMDSTRNNSPEALNEISRSWKELLESEDAFTEQLGKDLIYYSFYNSGFRTNISSYFEHIPSDYLANMLEEGIEDAKRNYSGGVVGLNNFVDKFFRNNWNNDEIVPIVQMKPTQLTGKNGKKITVNTLDSFTSTGTESNKYLKPYVKTRTFNQDDSVTVNLFKQVAVELDDKGKVIKSYYVRVPKLGYSKAGNNVAEWNSSTPIDGDSIIATNNLPTKVKEYMNVVQSTIDYNISNGYLFSAASIMDQAEVYARLITNDRDQNKDTQRGLDEGLINCGGE